jgi:hypothetical protein
MPWSAVAPNGKKLFIGYYDRCYGSCETSGCNDITMATIERPTTSAHVRAKDARRLSRETHPSSSQETLVALVRDELM